MKVLEDVLPPQSRAEAAPALGSLAQRDTVSALLDALDDGDPWVRRCAYVALKHLSGRDFFADWIFGSAADRQARAARYRTWFRE